MSVTISGQFIAEKKHIWVGLTAIYGIGKTRAMEICKAVNIPHDRRVALLTEAEIDKIRQEIGNYTVEGELRREVAVKIKEKMDLGLTKVLDTDVDYRSMDNEPRLTPKHVRSVSVNHNFKIH